MSEVPEIIEDFLKGNNDAGGTIESLEEEAKRRASQIETLENARDTAWNAGLEWAASWITGTGLIGKSEEIQDYARTMAMSIRAAQVGLTKRAPDVCPECAGSGKTGSVGLPHECPFCHGTGKRHEANR